MVHMLGKNSEMGSNERHAPYEWDQKAQTGAEPEQESQDAPRAF